MWATSKFQLRANAKRLTFTEGNEGSKDRMIKRNPSLSLLSSVSSDFYLQAVSEGELNELWSLVTAGAIREKTVQDLCVLINFKSCLSWFARLPKKSRN